jgi:O-antigen ligase
LTTVILAAGLVMIVVLATAIARPSLRMPAIAFGLLALPGNVDDLLPQLALDPHSIRDAMAPVVTSIDLLIVWALLLTVRESPGVGPTGRRVLGVAVVAAVVASIAVAVAALGGVPAGAIARGLILWWRIAALIYMAFALRAHLGDGRLLGLAIVAGGVVLLGNGVYTTVTDDLDRFTAKTFGRNGLAIALTVVTVIGTGVAADLWSRAVSTRDRWLAVGAATVAALSLFGMSATGTRIAFMMLLLAGVAALVLYPGRLGRRAVPGIALTFAVAVAVLAGSVFLTTAGGRTLSVVTDLDTTVDVVTDPGGTPTETEIRSRGEFWDLAVQMALDDPLTGVGPFQWNVVRYVMDPTGPVVVADAHQTYLQVAAEYGIPSLALYVILLASIASAIVPSLVSVRVRERLGWAGIGIVIGSGIIPIAAMTNAHVISPRNGPLEWLLLASAAAICVAAREGDIARTTEPK